MTGLKRIKMLKRVELTTVNGQKLTAEISDMKIPNIDTLFYYFTERDLKIYKCEDGTIVQTKYIVTVKEILDAEKEE